MQSLACSYMYWFDALCWWLYNSDSRNPFVEYAVQYAAAAAHATFDNDKKDALHKLLLQGNIWYFEYLPCLKIRHFQNTVPICN